MNSYKSVLSNFQMTKLGSRANTVSERIKVLKYLKILEQSQTNKMKFEGINAKLYIPVQWASFYMYKTWRAWQHFRNKGKQQKKA